MLRLSNINFSFTNKPLIEDFSFDVQKNEILHLKGPNGCGKSTLLRIIAGLIQPSSGEIEKKEACEILFAEKKGFYLECSAYTNLKFFRELKGFDQEDLSALLQRVSLENNIHQPRVKYFSTGMKQRLAMARIIGTPIWLLDEPYLGLDIKGCDLFTKIMGEHLNNNGCILVVSHTDREFKDLQPKVVSLS